MQWHHRPYKLAETKAKLWTVFLRVF